MKKTPNRNLSFKIILAQPRNPDNIGAAARAMANFGLNELALVSPHLPSWRDNAGSAAAADDGTDRLVESTRAAVGAADIIGAAGVFGSVAGAASDCSLLLGASALQRRTPNRDVVMLADVPAWLAGRLPAGKRMKVGIMFGSERSDLTNEEMSFCHALLNIPTSEKQPSINLGQAVSLVCYELAGRSAAPPRVNRPAAAPAIREIERVVEDIFVLLEQEPRLGIGFREHETEVRRALLDARMTKGAMNILKVLLRRARSVKRP